MQARELIEARREMFKADDSLEAVIDQLTAYSSKYSDNETLELVGKLTGMRRVIMETYYSIADRL